MPLNQHDLYPSKQLQAFYPDSPIVAPSGFNSPEALLARSFGSSGSSLISIVSIKSLQKYKIWSSAQTYEIQIESVYHTVNVQENPVRLCPFSFAPLLSGCVECSRNVSFNLISRLLKSSKLVCDNSLLNPVSLLTSLSISNCWYGMSKGMTQKNF